MVKLTQRERIVLTYLCVVDVSSAATIGEEIICRLTDKAVNGRIRSIKNFSSVGVAVLRNLRKRGLVQLHHKHWSITNEGRDALRLSK